MSEYRVLKKNFPPSLLIFHYLVNNYLCDNWRPPRLEFFSKYPMCVWIIRYPKSTKMHSTIIKMYHEDTHKVKSVTATILYRVFMITVTCGLLGKGSLEIRILAGHLLMIHLTLLTE